MDYTKMTKGDLAAELDKKKIAYEKSDLKGDLIKKLEAADNAKAEVKETAATPEAEPVQEASTTNLEPTADFNAINIGGVVTANEGYVKGVKHSTGGALLFCILGNIFMPVVLFASFFY